MIGLCYHCITSVLPLSNHVFSIDLLSWQVLVWRLNVCVPQTSCASLIQIELWSWTIKYLDINQNPVWPEIWSCHHYSWHLAWNTLQPHSRYSASLAGDNKPSNYKSCTRVARLHLPIFLILHISPERANSAWNSNEMYPGIHYLFTYSHPLS